MTAPDFASPSDLPTPFGYSHVVRLPPGRWCGPPARWRSVRDEFIDTDRPPTSSLVQVAGLFRPDLLIEVEAVAWLP